FMPQSGTMALWQMPSQLRVEDALQSGGEIPPYYDSMIAKIISHGDTRDAARRQLMAGLEDAVALGVKTNQAFLNRCLGHPVFAAGGATTAFIAQNQEALLAPDTATQERAAAIAAVLLYETTAGRRPATTGRRMTHSLPISLRFELDGGALSAGIVLTRQRHFDVSIGERTHAIELEDIGEHAARVACDGLCERVAFHRDGAVLLMHYRGVPVRVEDKTRAATVRQGEAGGDGKVRASMNGRVVAVLAAIGDQVEAGQPVITLEAMKMEHIHAAPVAGRLTALHVKVGDQVAASRIVAEIEVAVAIAAEAAAVAG
ncbi:MAG: 3-methylcrotonyl-CoA carboxylase, partial [Comamonadaceae bacterium]